MINSKKNIEILGTILFITLLIGYYISEDTLGGAREDYLFHEKFIILFAEDFKSTFENYGKGELFARNSPIFYIFISFFYKLGITLENIRYLNIISLLLMLLILIASKFGISSMSLIIITSSS